MKRSSNIDSEALKKFKELGLSLDKEQEMEFFFYFPREHNAYFAAVELSRLQFRTNIDFAEPDTWLCLATKTMKPTAERLDHLRSWMERVARRNDGEYDGWGSGILLGEKH